jgi:four helix bundle protein
MAQYDELFVFERMDVYRVARQAAEIVIRHREALRGLPGEMASQLERASVSTVANIAEACGRLTIADRRKHFAIARAEANEAGAMMELVQLYRRFPNVEYATLRRSLLRVTYMLTALVR